MFAELQTKGFVRYEDLPLRTISGVKIAVEFVSNSYDCAGAKVIQCNICDISGRKCEGILHSVFDTAQTMPCPCNRLTTMVNPIRLNLSGGTHEYLLHP